MDLTTALIWTIRIVLPIILFIVYFKLQSPKEESSFSRQAGSTKNRYSRSQLLTARKAVSKGEAPSELETITLKGQAEAPSLFESSGRTFGKGGGRREDGGGKGKGRGRGSREPREPREPREAREPKEKRSDDITEKPPEDEVVTALDESVSGEAVATPAALGAAQLSANKEKMHLESLLNWVAFHRKEQQRVFLMEEGSLPPPPPKHPQPLDLSFGRGDASTEKANSEAQMVLKGALTFKRSDVVKDLHSKLEASKVDISASTFALMIEACIRATDLRGASDFLMKMESSGHSPSSELLDKVMDLYSTQKSQREMEKQQRKEIEEAEKELLKRQAELAQTAQLVAGEEESQPKIKLSASAALFVPTFVPPAPLLIPAAPTEGLAVQEPEQASGTEQPQVVTTAPPEVVAPPRTKLTSAAKPFAPSFTPAFEPIITPIWVTNADQITPVPVWDSNINAQDWNKWEGQPQTEACQEARSNKETTGRDKGNKGAGQQSKAKKDGQKTWKAKS